MEKITIELADIFEYTASARPIKEGEAVFKAGHVLICGIKDDGSGTILGSCLQTSHLNGDPHTIEILLDKNINNWKANCSCRAGLEGKCKHIVAVLLHINRAEEIEKLSCTDLEQVWGKLVKQDDKQYSLAIKLEEFCHPTLKKKKIEPIGDVKSVWEENFKIIEKTVMQRPHMENMKKEMPEDCIL